MSKQTAVEWFIDQLKEYDFSPRENTYLIEIPSWILTEKQEQAKAMEKEQIINAHLTGLIHPLEIEATKQTEQYYNETYGGDK
jgi:hypothetical protein